MQAWCRTLGVAKVTYWQPDKLQVCTVSFLREQRRPKWKHARPNLPIGQVHDGAKLIHGPSGFDGVPLAVRRRPRRSLKPHKQEAVDIQM